MNMQLEEEMCTNSRGQSGGRITMRHYSNCGEPGHNTHIYKKDKEMSNIYSFE